MKTEEIKSRILTLSDDTHTEVKDLTGTENHYQALVVSSKFEKTLKIEQHRIVFDLFKEELRSGEIHALQLQTYTPEQFNK